MKDIRRCLVCGGHAFRQRYAATFSGDWQNAVPLFLTQREKAVRGRIVQCDDCGFVFTSPQFEAEEYARIYQAVPAAPTTPASDNAQRLRFEGLARRVGGYVSEGRFIDLGCGSGMFHRSMAGFDGYGFEVAAGDGHTYQEQSRTFVGDFAAFCDTPEHAGRYDFVTAWDVFEHLAEPDRVMQGLRAIIKPGGWLFCTVPDISSWVARLSGRSWNCLLLEHLWYFAPKTLESYAQRFAFEPVEITSLGYPVDVQTIAIRLAQTYGGRPIRLADWMGKRVIDFPIGLMFGAFRLPLGPAGPALAPDEEMPK